jgi:hypothetical protein
MSSLMQFNGSITHQGVGLQFILVEKDEPDWTRLCGPESYHPNPESTAYTKDVDRYQCATCGRQHARIAVAYRKPVGMFGCWVQFRYNGSVHVPDLSIPIAVFKLPRDARGLSDEDSSKIWHSS